MRLDLYNSSIESGHRHLRHLNLIHFLHQGGYSVHPRIVLLEQFLAFPSQLRHSAHLHYHCNYHLSTGNRLRLTRSTGGILGLRLLRNQGRRVKIGSVRFTNDRVNPRVCVNSSFNRGPQVMNELFTLRRFFLNYTLSVISVNMGYIWVTGFHRRFNHYFNPGPLRPESIIKQITTRNLMIRRLEKRGIRFNLRLLNLRFLNRPIFYTLNGNITRIRRNSLLLQISRLGRVLITTRSLRPRTHHLTLINRNAGRVINLGTKYNMSIRTGIYRRLLRIISVLGRTLQHFKTTVFMTNINLITGNKLNRVRNRNNVLKLFCFRRIRRELRRTMTRTNKRTLKDARTALNVFNRNMRKAGNRKVTVSRRRNKRFNKKEKNDRNGARS